jgi:cytoskeletal protein CcmA (bactofilin family)
MFKNEKDGLNNETETVIAPSVRVEGDFVSEGNIRVEGVVSGSIATERDLLVGENAKITASVVARNSVIAGEMHGNLKIGERLELSATARVYGDIQAKVLAVAPGAMMRGNLTIGMEPEAAKEETVEAKAAARPVRSTREKKIEEILTQQ